MRKLLLPTLALLALDLGATALSPATGLSLTADAHAQSVKWTGKIKRIKIKRRRVGGGYKVVSRIADDGDATSASAATLAVQVCAGDLCSAPASLGQDEYVGAFASRRFAFDGAVMPTGEHELLTALRDGDGNAVGMLQSWTLKAEGEELVATPIGDVDGAPYISELTMTSDACGNGKAKARVTGDAAADVGGVEWISLDGVLFSKDDTVACADGDCITGDLKRGATRYTQSDADLGELGAVLAELDETDVTVTVTAYDADGGVIGTASTAAVAKYGDILIDGVPLEFDRTAGDDGGITGVSVTTAVDGAAVLETWTDGSAGVSTVEGTLTDLATGEIQECKATESGAVQQSFASPPVAFDPGASPDEQLYLVLVDLLDGKGDPTGEQYEAELFVPAFDGETVGSDYVVFPDGLGAVGLLQGEDGIVAHVAWEGGGDVAGANVIFEEPFEGPAPLETELSLDQVASFDNSALTCSGKVPDAWTAQVSAFDKEGAVLGTVSGSGAGEDVVYSAADNGGGSGLTVNLTVRGNLDVRGKLGG